MQYNILILYQVLPIENILKNYTEATQPGFWLLNGQNTNIFSPQDPSCGLIFNSTLTSVVSGFHLHAYNPIPLL